MKNWFTLLFTALVVLTQANQNRKVLLIGIDGTRSDAFQQANTPNIDGLLANATYTYDAWHTCITWSGPSWSSILTGVNWNKHGVTDNNFTGSQFATYPPIATLAKQIKPGIKASIVAEWDPLIDDITSASWDRAIKVPDGETFPTADSAVAQLQDTGIDFLFAYFDHVDLTGHTTTFSPSNPLYIKAIQQVDTAVGSILTALHNRPNYANEDWLVMVITDHGGTSFFHGGNSNEERHIWWIASGSAVAHQQMAGQDPGTYNCSSNNVFTPSCVDVAKLKATPSQNDIAVTAVHHLIYDSGINPETKPEWNLDGKSWLLGANSIAEASAEEIAIYPNPANYSVKISVSNPQNVKLFDMLGREVQAKPFTLNDGAVYVDVSTLPNGNYVVQAQVEGQLRVSKLIVMH